MGILAITVLKLSEQHLNKRLFLHYLLIQPICVNRWTEVLFLLLERQGKRFVITSKTQGGTSPDMIFLVTTEYPNPLYVLM